MSRLRAVLAAPVVATVAAGGVLAVQAQLARRRPYAVDPDFVIDEVVGSGAAQLRLAVIGDSTVAGVGVDDVRDSLPVQIATRMSGEIDGAVHVTGHGVSGACISDLLETQVPLIGDADVVVIEIGSNDVVRGTALGAIEHELERLLLAVRAEVGTVVLGGAGRLDTPNFAPPLRQLVVRRSRAVRAMQASVARRTACAFVDIGGEVAERFSAAPGHTSWDGFHPSAIGYGIWADALADAAVTGWRSQSV